MICLNCGSRHTEQREVRTEKHEFYICLECGYVSRYATDKSCDCIQIEIEED